MHRPTIITRWKGTDSRRQTDEIVVEEPLEIRVNDAPYAVTMRTPGQDNVLAVGFLATEGLLRQQEDLFDITRCADPSFPDLHNIINVYVPPERAPQTDADSSKAGRQRYATASCGLCGRATIEAVHAAVAPLGSPPCLSHAVLTALPDRLRAAQKTFAHTGGLHAAGLFDLQGELLYAEEDVGRHNAVDKVIGRAFLSDRWPLENVLLMVSGRAGFEIAQKAIMARIPVLCSVSAPSSLAVELAHCMNLVLVGFLRGNTMNVYAGADSVS